VFLCAVFLGIVSQDSVRTVIEILKSFEQVASRFDPAVLMVLGLAMVALGLIAWLGGMCVRRLVLALAGALAGAIAGLLIGGPNAAIVGAAGGLGAIFGAILPRLAGAIFLAALGIAVAFAVTAQKPLAEGAKTLFGKPDVGRGEERLTTQQSLDTARSYAVDLADRVKSAACQLGAVDLAVVAGVGVVLLAVGLLLIRLAGALVCSVLGAALIFAGLTALLILKGSAPISLMQKQGAFYGLVFLGMTAFGTLEQLVLCPSPRRRVKPGPQGSRSRREESEHHWRSH